MVAANHDLKRTQTPLSHTFPSQTSTQSNHLDIRAHSKHQRRLSLHTYIKYFHSHHKIQFCTLAILPYHQTHSLATKRRPRLPVPAFSDAATDIRRLSRAKIYSLDPLTCKTCHNRAQPRASRSWLQHITTSNAPKRLTHTHTDMQGNTVQSQGS